LLVFRAEGLGLFTEWWGSSTTGEGEEETLPEALSSVACNCERMNVINYIFNKKIARKGEEAELELGTSFGGGWG